MNPPPYIWNPERIGMALDEQRQRMESPGHELTERDCAELLNLYERYKEYLKWLEER